MPSARSIVIFSGGTAANHLVDIFETLRKRKDCPISYIIPISDNGGSSSELIRVFGGPGIGDVRSRLVRLIPHLPPTSPGFKEREAIRSLFNHRLDSTDSRAAKLQWTDIVEGTSPMWKDISSAKKELIRSFFNVINLEITKRSRPPSSTFDFSSASVGNLFLTAARLFTGSFESAIYMLGSICGVEDEGVKVIPSINSTFSHHIAAGLEDASVIVGQNAISHPSPEASSTLGTMVVQTITTSHTAHPVSDGNPRLPHRMSLDHYYGDEYDQSKDSEPEPEEEEDANLPGTLPTLRTRNIKFNKDAHLNEDLPSRIERIWYINPYGQEILPPANPRAISAINSAQAVIYSIGSLYTSLAPSLILRGIGDALRRNNTSATHSSSSTSHPNHHSKPTLANTCPLTKILILNGSLDREVGPQPPHPSATNTRFSALDFIESVVRACEQSRGNIWDGHSETHPNTNTHTPNGTNTPPNNPHKYSSRSTYLSQPPDPPIRIPSPQSRTTRPGLLSSKSAETVPLSHRYRSPQPHSHLQHQHHLNPHLFPPPLLASNNPSRAPSPAPSPPPGGALRPTEAQWSEGAQWSEEVQRSNGDQRPDGSQQSEPDHRPVYTDYVTHLIHLPNHAVTPYVDVAALARHGIATVQVEGDMEAGGEGMRYDAVALGRALEAILHAEAGA